MNNQELKTIWKLSKICYIASFLLWIIKTLLFLLIEGWHIKATNPIEINLDKTVENGLKAAIFTTVFFCINTSVNLIRSRNVNN